MENDLFISNSPSQNADAPQRAERRIVNTENKFDQLFFWFMSIPHVFERVYTA